ncbi:hypothetical protein E2562_005929 [Oryza meyeriana var. granulata]|uniref:Uncharacterized protein n=1 Tax=Oryza meyeriana var. granulata TaxID=110450 RepID=A0A6G1DUY3_9ORYZ|nr:hypothetical protein E2562_005929 [Oryza meyeriana var. granulata]
MGKQKRGAGGVDSLRQRLLDGCWRRGAAARPGKCDVSVAGQYRRNYEYGRTAGKEPIEGSNPMMLNH